MVEQLSIDGIIELFNNTPVELDYELEVALAKYAIQLLDTDNITVEIFREFYDAYVKYTGTTTDYDRVPLVVSHLGYFSQDLLLAKKIKLDTIAKILSIIPKDQECLFKEGMQVRVTDGESPSMPMRKLLS